MCEGGLVIIKIKNQRILGGLKVNPGDTEVSAFGKSFPSKHEIVKKKKAFLLIKVGALQLWMSTWQIP